MIRYLNKNDNTCNNYCDILDLSYMIEIPDNGELYKLINNEIVKDSEKELVQAKQDKLAENSQKRDEKLLAGVTYQNVLFDSDTDQKINLMFAANSMSDTDTVIWFGKNNDPLECTKADILAIGALVSELTSKIWSEINPQYIAQINSATTVEEVNAIVIDYSAA